MKKLAVAAIALAAMAAVGVWWMLSTQPLDVRYQDGMAAVVPAPQSNSDPTKVYSPEGWKVVGTKQFALETVKVPFLHKQLKGRQVIESKLEGMCVVFKSAEMTFENKDLSKGTLLTLADTGQLLRIELFGDSEATFFGQRDVEKMEDRLSSTSEKFDGLPQGSPKLVLQDLLNKAFESGFGSVEKAKRIEVMFAVSSRHGTPGSSPAWMVSFFGLPPLPARGASKVAPEARTNLRFLFDTNGKLLSADNQT